MKDRVARRDATTVWSRRAKEGRSGYNTLSPSEAKTYPMPEFYSPDENWPRHQESYWRGALDVARAGGWRLKHLGAAHTYGWVSCPSGEHERKIGQTARNNETKAKELIKAVGTCEQRGCGIDPADAAAQRAKIDRLLRTALQIVVQAETGLDLLHGRRAADRELDRLDALRLQLETAEAGVEAARAEEEIAELEEQALEAAVALAADGPGAEDLRTDLETAAEHTRAARAEAAGLRPPSDADSARSGADALYERIRAAIHRLDDLQERSEPSDG